MQIVYFAKTDNPSGKIKNAERYGYSVANGVLLGVSLIGPLTEADDDNWQASRAEVSCATEATADNAVKIFQQAAKAIGGFEINESYIRAIFEE